MTSKPEITFAVLGCGHIGKRHAEMIQRNENCVLIALIDIKDSSQLGISNYDVPFFNSLDAFFNSGIKVDVLCIATPNAFHASQAQMALQNHCHVVLEKPMALSTFDAQNTLDIAKKYKKHIFNVMQNRYSPPSVWLKSILDEKRLGEIYLVELNCFWNRDERYYTPESWHGKLALDGGTLFTQFSHFIDILFWLFGDVTNIQSEFYNFNHQQLTDFEDSGICKMEFENGGKCSFNFSTSVWDSNLESSISIIAENGSVKVGGQYMEKVEYCNIKNYQMPNLQATNPGNDYGNYKGSASNHHFVYKNIVDVLHHQSAIDAAADEGVKVVNIIERIYQSGNRERFLKTLISH